MENQQITGILWWKPEQWEKAKRISDDSELFDDSYQEWKEAAEKTLKNFRDLGLTVYKVEVDLDELVKWCEEKGKPLDGEARSDFVSKKVQELHESKRSDQ